VLYILKIIQKRNTCMAKGTKKGGKKGGKGGGKKGC
jgi:hypothetical protein